MENHIVITEKAGVIETAMARAAKIGRQTIGQKMNGNWVVCDDPNVAFREAISPWHYVDAKGHLERVAPSFRLVEPSLEKDEDGVLDIVLNWGYDIRGDRAVTAAEAEKLANDHGHALMTPEQGGVVKFDINNHLIVTIWPKDIKPEVRRFEVGQSYTARPKRSGWFPASFLFEDREYKYKIVDRTATEVRFLDDSEVEGTTKIGIQGGYEYFCPTGADYRDASIVVWAN